MLTARVADQSQRRGNGAIRGKPEVPGSAHHTTSSGRDVGAVGVAPKGTAQVDTLTAWLSDLGLERGGEINGNEMGFGGSKKFPLEGLINTHAGPLPSVTPKLEQH